MLRAMLRWFVALAGVAGRARRIRGTGPCAVRGLDRARRAVLACAWTRTLDHVLHGPHRTCVRRKTRARANGVCYIIFITGVYLNICLVLKRMVYLETARRSPAISSTPIFSLDNLYSYAAAT